MTSWRIRRLDSTASTNDDIRQAAEAGEAEGLVIHARQQTSGRGRHGRQWISSEGNLYGSILLRPGDAIPSGLYSFVAALALYDMVRSFLPAADIRLKWPNDVLVEGAKIGGILLEAGQGYLIIGIGLNVKHHPANLPYPATSLAACGVQVIPEAVLGRLLEHLGIWHKTAQTEGFGSVRQAWLSHARKGQMSVKLPQGQVQGEFVDLATDGRLILRLADGAEKAIATGDVFPISG